MSKRLRALLIDDEPDSIKLLQLQIEHHCPTVEIIETFYNPKLALSAIPRIAPDLLFLDIEMPYMTGIELLQKLKSHRPKVIFVTASNQYAIKAFRLNAIDYLLKPYEVEHLKDAVLKASSTSIPSEQQLDLAQRQMNGELPKKIAVHTQNGVSFIELDEIVFAEASNNYTKLIMRNGKQIILSKTLKDVQEVLEGTHFLRIHRQYIVNLNHIRNFNRTDYIVSMIDNSELPISKNQKDKLLAKYGCL